MPSNFPALILTAGLGTRLRPLTDVRAKPAIPVAGEPLVRRIARWLAAGGVTDIVLNLHHRPETIAATMGDGSDLGARVRYSWEQPAVLGAAGGPRQALSIVGADTFLLINGDTLTDVDLADLADAHHGSGARVTLALVPNREPLRYGGIRLDPGGRVTGFPVVAKPTGRITSSGCRWFGPMRLRSAGADQPAASIGAYDRLIDREPARRDPRVRVRCHVLGRGYGRPTTGPRRGRSSTLDRMKPARSAGASASIQPHAWSRSILWDDVDVPRDVVLDECLVTDGVRLPAGATYRRTILLRGPDARLNAVPLCV